MSQNSYKVPSVGEQETFWNAWNRDFREHTAIDAASERRGAFALETARFSSKGGPIIDIGCGTGWLSARLTQFGEAWGTDLAEDVLSRSQERWPEIKFYAGDFMQLSFPESHFELCVCLETISHVPDQTAFVQKIADLITPGGTIIITSQNPFVWHRTSGLKPPGEGQIRNWPDKRTFRRLLAQHFEITRTTSLFPSGDQGILRFANNRITNALGRRILSDTKFNLLKEWLGYGQSLAIIGIKK